MKIYQDIPLPKFSDLNPFLFRSKKNNSLFTGSGKASLSLILKYLRFNKIIETKSQEVLVPKWLGYWVYNQINEHCFASNVLTNDTRVVLLYHQFGIPQDVEKWLPVIRKNKLIVIEDCAHLLRDPNEHSVFDFSIYSFSKFFFCYALGAISSGDEKFWSFFQREKEKSSSLKLHLINLIKLYSEWARKSISNFNKKSLSNELIAASYSWYGSSFKHASYAESLFCIKFKNELNIRKKRFLFLKSTFQAIGRVRFLGDLEVAPYAFPLDVFDDEGVIIINKLKNIGIYTGTYQFDINRFSLSPDYKTVALVYLHSQIPDDIFFKQVDLIKEVFSQTSKA